MTTPSTPDPGMVSRVWRYTAALRAGVIAGAVAGAVIAGGGGRTAMRIVALVDESSKGVRTDFGAIAGEITLGGTFTLIMLMTVAGTMGGVLYIAVRRWLPWDGVARGLAFGFAIAFGPGTIAVGEIDLQIFEPPLLFLAIFVSIQVVYGLVVALIADRLHAAPPVHAGRRSEIAVRVITVVAALGMSALAVGIVGNTIDNAGSCVTAAEGGGCAVRVSP